MPLRTLDRTDDQEASMADPSTMDILRESRLVAFTTGALMLVAGLTVLFWPDRTLIVVARIAGILIVATGIAEIAEAVTAHRRGTYWGLLVLQGAVNVVAGLLLLFWPDITLMAVVWLVGLAHIVTGAIGIIVFSTIPAELGRSTYLWRAAVRIVFGVVLVAWPDATLTVLALVVGVGLVALALTLLFSGYQLGRAAHA
jgi:uncharacterized membrane protein HdeD (DUF308 family)